MAKPNCNFFNRNAEREGIGERQMTPRNTILLLLGTDLLV